MSGEKRARIVGRFNYVVFQTDYFNVIFLPWGGTQYQVIAVNLPKEEAVALTHDLNEGLRVTNAEFYEYGPE